MDIKTIALLSGVKPESVVEHKHVNGADLMRIALKNEPGLRRSLAARADDIFDLDFVLDGAAPRKFVPDQLDKERNNSWYSPGEVPMPGWNLRAEVYPPNSSYGVILEKVSIWVFDHHDGPYDLSVADEILARPWMRYSLGFQTEADYISMIGVNPVSGIIEVSSTPVGEGSMRLNGALSNVVFNMPNCHDVIEQAPDRAFVVTLPSGFYELYGQL